MIIDEHALQRIASLLVESEPDRQALADEWDKAIRLKRIGWMPAWLSAGFEKNDRRFNLALADATLHLRERLLAMGSLALRS